MRSREGRGRGRRALLCCVLALAGALLGLGLVEASVRVFRLDGYRPPELHLPDGRRFAGLAEIADVFAPEGAARPDSLTRMPPNAVALGWYDRPRWDNFDEDGCVEYRTNSLGFRDRDSSGVRRSCASWRSATPSRSAPECDSRTAGCRCSSASSRASIPDRSRS